VKISPFRFVEIELKIQEVCFASPLVSTLGLQANLQKLLNFLCEAYLPRLVSKITAVL
jgi:hypothetical protein